MKNGLLQKKIPPDDFSIAPAADENSVKKIRIPQNLRTGVFQRNVPENPHAFSIVLNQCFRNFINGSVKDVDEVRFPADKGGFDTDCCFVRCRKQFRWFPVDDGAGAVRFAEALIKKGLHMVFIAHQACGTETA